MLANSIAMYLHDVTLTSPQDRQSDDDMAIMSCHSVLQVSLPLLLLSLHASAAGAVQNPHAHWPAAICIDKVDASAM